MSCQIHNFSYRLNIIYQLFKETFFSYMFIIFNSRVIYCKKKNFQNLKNVEQQN